MLKLKIQKVCFERKTLNDIFDSDSQSINKNDSVEQDNSDELSKSCSTSYMARSDDSSIRIFFK